MFLLIPEVFDGAADRTASRREGPVRGAATAHARGHARSKAWAIRTIEGVLAATVWWLGMAAYKRVRMDYLFTQAGRFWWWVQQGGNSSLVLVAITAWYVYLTHRIMKATARQATALLQPALSIVRLVKPDEEGKRCLLIQNLGSQPVVFLDVVVGCFPYGKPGIVRRLRGWDDIVLPAGKDAELDYDFSKDMGSIHVSPDACGYQALIVVSDLSRQVGGQYEYLPVLGRLSFTLGVPLRVRLRYMARPWGWRYHRLKSRFAKK